MTQGNTIPNAERGTSPSPQEPATPEPPGQGRGRTPWLIGGILAVAAATLGIVAMSGGGDDEGTGWQTADVREQGETESVYATNGARLQRRTDGLFVEIDVAVFEPGTYEYPTNDMIPPWVESHPLIGQGVSDAPEIFTLWLFAFNEPSRCTDGQCDSDDIGTDVAALGGVYQVDGRVADDDRLHFYGNVRLGEQQLDGAPLENPFSAEVHVAIAPHGRALSGEDRVVQLNTPVGNPTLWWGASFETPV